MHKVSYKTTKKEQKSMLVKEMLRTAQNQGNPQKFI